MEPLVLILVPGFLGGLVMAWWFVRLHRKRRADATAVTEGDGLPPTDVINMARIRVAGIGGLGFVATALVVAWVVPRIGQTLAVGFALGVLFAAVLIVLRRERGPLPSSGRQAGAHTTLSIDHPPRAEDEVKPRSPTLRVGLVPASPNRSSRPA